MTPWRIIPCLCAIGVVAGCGGGESPAGPPVPTTIVIAPPVSTTFAGGTVLQLGAIVKDQRGTAISGQSISWLSSDQTHATVLASGSVTGLLAGLVTITATSGSLTSAPLVLMVVTGTASAIIKQRDVAAGIVVGGADSIALRITDGGGNPVAGTSVTFAVVSGGGTLNATTAVSGGDGVAGVRWTIGPGAGTQTASATAILAGVPTTITFGATAVAGATTIITKVGSNPTSAPALSNVDSIRVKLTDQFGNPKSGEVVTFAATAGGGSVSPTSATTGPDGLAAARWTMGPTANTVNTATATRAGLASSPITFATTTIQAAVASVAIVGARVVVLDSAATLPLNFVARDISGNNVVGGAFTIVSRSPATAVSNGIVTGALRGSTFVVVSSTQTPSASDSLFVTVAIPGAPVVIADLARLDLKTDTTFTIGVTVDMRTSGAKLGAATIQVTWDPTVMTYQSDVDGSAGAGATVNTNNTASGALTMSMASSMGFPGAVQLRKITFKASSQPGQSGRLSLFVSELTTASTFINLLSSTVAAIYPLITR